MESLRCPVICHPSRQPSIYSCVSSSTSKSRRQMSCPHSNFFPSVLLFAAQGHKHTHAASISPPDVQSHWPRHLSHKPPLFLHRSSLLSFHRKLSGASGCYRAPGNQRYSHMSQIGVNSYYSGERGGGVKASENSLIRKDIAVTPAPHLPLTFSICQPPCWMSPYFFHPFIDQ